MQTFALVAKKDLIKMFELQLGTEFFLPRRFVASANHNITGWIAIHKQQRYFAQEIFFFLLKSDRHKKGKKQTNKKKKTRKKQNTTIKPTIKCRKVTLASAGLSY